MRTTRSANCAATLRSCITTRHASLALLHLGREQLVEIELVAHVEERARLVEEQHLRLLRERARDRDALLLAAATARSAGPRRASAARSQRASASPTMRASSLGRAHPAALMRRAPHRDDLAHREVPSDAPASARPPRGRGDRRARERREVGSPSEPNLALPGASEPGATRTSVVLPAPFGPKTQTISPAATPKIDGGALRVLAAPGSYPAVTSRRTRRLFASELLDALSS